MKKDLLKNLSKLHVVYHKNCLDGLLSAALVSIALDKEKLMYDCIPCQYGEELHIEPDSTVIFVDFSLKNNEMRKIIEKSKNVLVYDHHITALEELENLQDEYDNFELYFDNNVCGSEVVYKNFILPLYGNTLGINKNLIEFATDWDLFKFKKVETKNIRFYLDFFTGKKDLDKMKMIALMEDSDLLSLIKDGKIIADFSWNSAKKISDANLTKDGNLKNKINVNGYNVLAINNTSGISEVGNQICLDHDIVSLQYFIANGKVVCSLRSTDDLPDASKLAKFFGGGGHRNACGFQIPLEQLSNFLNSGFQRIKRFPATALKNSEKQFGYYYITKSGRALMYTFNGVAYHYKNNELQDLEVDFRSFDKII